MEYREIMMSTSLAFSIGCLEIDGFTVDGTYHATFAVGDNRRFLGGNVVQLLCELRHYGLSALSFLGGKCAEYSQYCTVDAASVPY